MKVGTFLSRGGGFISNHVLGNGLLAPEINSLTQVFLNHARYMEHKRTFVHSAAAHECPL